MKLRPIFIWPIMSEMESGDVTSIDNDDHEIWDDDNYKGGYPWKGAIIAFCITVVVVIFGVLPWAWGMINILVSLID